MTGFLVDFRQIGVARSEGAGGAFAVDQEFLLLAVYRVGFELGVVVTDLVEGAHLCGRQAEDLDEGLAGEVR